MRLSKVELKKERVLVDMFVASRLVRNHLVNVPMSAVYYEFKQFHKDTKLSVDGFGKMMPNKLKDCSQLIWFSGKPRRCFMGWDLVV